MHVPTHAQDYRRSHLPSILKQMAKVVDNVRVSEAFKHCHLLPEILLLFGLLSMQDLHGHVQPLPACLVHLTCTRLLRQEEEARSGSTTGEGGRAHSVLQQKWNMHHQSLTVQSSLTA